MGQKVHPTIFRIGELYTWPSKWFARNKDYPRLLQQDLEIKKYLRKELKEAAVANIEIERSPSATTLIIHSAKPGVIIGRGGQGIEELKKKVKKMFVEQKTALNINIQEITDPNSSAALVCQGIIADLEKRFPFRRAMKQAIGRVEKTKAKGVKVMVSGRLNGSEIARRETLTSGSLPLHTLRADIDYQRGVAHTSYGTIGVKVWIYKGQVFKKQEETAAAKPAATPVAKPSLKKK